MVFRIAKFIFKMVLGVVLGILFVWWLGASVVAWVNDSRDIHNDMSFVVKDVERCDHYPAGTLLQCPICQKNFIKEDIDFCSTKCEQKYWAMKKEYDIALQSEKNLNKMGKRYQ